MTPEIEEGYNCINCRLGRIELLLEQMSKDMKKLAKRG
jgi:hypothetical protein